MKITCWALFLTEDLVSSISDCSLCLGCPAQKSICLPGDSAPPLAGPRQSRSKDLCFDKHSLGQTEHLCKNATRTKK